MKLMKDLGIRLIKGHWFRYAIFKCSECLQEVERQTSAGKITKSCGCVRYSENKKNYKHGFSKTKLYMIWNNMKQRVLNPKRDNYKYYGGRGITICPEWTDKLNGFITFRDWALSNEYADNLVIDRINPDGNYEPSNCRFLTIEESNRNKRKN